MAENGVWLAGFSTTGQPAAMAGASLWATRFSGKLNGVMAPTTPMGSRSVKPSLPSPAAGRVERDHLAGQRAGLGRRELERAHGPLGLDPRRLDRLGRLVGDGAGELLGPLGEEGRGPVEDLGPLPRRERAFVQRGLGGGDGAVDVGGGAGRHGPEDGAVVGRVHLDDVVGGEALASER